MGTQPSALQPGRQVQWIHNGKPIQARVIKQTLTQVKLRLLGSGGAEYWVSLTYVRAPGQSAGSEPESSMRGDD